MTTDDSILLETFRYRLNDLIRAYNKTREEFESYRQKAAEELQQKDLEIGELKERLAEMQEKYASLQAARLIAGGEGDAESTREMLNGLVREIDKCIALLNS